MAIKNSLKVFDIVFRDRFRYRLGNIVLQSFLFIIFLTFTFIFINLNHYLMKTSSSVVFFAFLKEPITQEKLSSTKKAIANWPEVLTVKTISKEEGMSILKKTLGKEGTILNTLESNPLPYTLEISIKPNYTEKTYLKQIGEKLKKYDTIDWFDSTEKFISPLLQIKKYVSLLFSIGTATVILLILLTLRTTTKVFFFKYKDALSLLKFLGAKNIFILFPFIFEGFLEVFFSATFSSLVSYYLSSFVKNELAILNINVTLLPPIFYVAFVSVFSFLGALGGFSLKTKEL